MTKWFIRNWDFLLGFTATILGSTLGELGLYWFCVPCFVVGGSALLVALVKRE